MRVTDAGKALTHNTSHPWTIDSARRFNPLYSDTMATGFILRSRRGAAMLAKGIGGVGKTLNMSTSNETRSCNFLN